MGQNILALNVPVDIESHVCAEDEIKLITLPLCDLSTGEFKVIAKTLAYVNACVKKKKKRISNTFNGTVFKKHFTEMLNERGNEPF